VSAYGKVSAARGAQRSKSALRSGIDPRILHSVPENAPASARREGDGLHGKGNLVPAPHRPTRTQEDARLVKKRSGEGDRAVERGIIIERLILSHHCALPPAP
jgi:hypothetical protein